MIYLLYGEDTYRSRRKLREIIEHYQSRGGPMLNFHRLDLEEDNIETLNTIIGAPSLFSAKKFIVLEYALSGKEGFSSLVPVLKRAQEHKNDLVLILWDREMGAGAKKHFKELQALIDKIQEFKFLSGAALERWVREEALRRGTALSTSDASYLCGLGSDLWMVSNELDKCALALRDIHVYNKENHTVFNLGDVFFSSKQKALLVLSKLVSRGEDDFQIFSYLLNYNRTLIAVRSYLENGKSVPQTAGIHPFVVKKASLLVRTLNLEHLCRAFAGFLEEDFKIKIGISKPKESLVFMLIHKSGSNVRMGRNDIWTS